MGDLHANCSSLTSEPRHLPSQPCSQPSATTKVLTSYHSNFLQKAQLKEAAVGTCINMTSDRLKRLIPFRHSASRDGEDRLCVACQRVVTKLAVHDEPLNYKHRATSRELVEDRALQGCPLCLRFLALLSPEDRKAMRDHKDRSSGSPINLWNDRYEVKYYMYGRPPVILYPIGQILPEVDRYVTITLEYHAPKQSWNTRSWKLEAILNDASSLDDTSNYI